MSTMSEMHLHIMSRIERASFLELLCIESTLQELRAKGGLLYDFTRALKARFAELCCD